MLRIIGIIIFAVVFSSCTNKADSILAVFKATEEGLIQSNSVISNSSNVIYKELNTKLTEPVSAGQASVWQPKAILIKGKSAGIIRYLDSLIVELKKEAGLKLENMKEVYREDDLDAVSRFFINKNTGDELYKKLKNHKQDMLTIDPELNKQFGANAIIITRKFELAGKNSKEFTETFFNHVPVITALAMIRKLENNVRVLENKFVEFCYQKIGSIDGDAFFDKVGVIIAQSTTTIKAGDKIEITAGIGTFSMAGNPKITIHGKLIQMENAVASYKFKTPLKAGKYFVPVKIEYTDLKGMINVKMDKLKYTVLE